MVRVNTTAAVVVGLDGAGFTIYGYHMDQTTKTTVYLDADVYRRLKALAAKDGRTTAALVREAVAEYAVRHAPVRMPRSLGIGRSRRRDLGSRAEQLLEGFGRDA